MLTGIIYLYGDVKKYIKKLGLIKETHSSLKEEFLLRYKEIETMDITTTGSRFLEFTYGLEDLIDRINTIDPYYSIPETNFITSFKILRDLRRFIITGDQFDGTNKYSIYINEQLRTVLNINIRLLGLYIKD